jgi:hypothetical protein
MPAPDFQSQLVSDHSVEPIKALSHVGRSKSDVDPGRRPKPKHRSNLLNGSDQARQGLSIKISPDFNSPTLGQHYFQSAGSWSAAVALHPSHLHLNQSLTFALSLDFHPSPSEPTLQRAQRQIMLVTKFAPPQSTGFEFPHQSFDLLAASSLPNANLSDFRHVDSASKTRSAR